MGKRILIAEDDPSVRLTIELILDHAGFEVSVAADGEEALEAALANPPDAILLDQMMPKMNGKEVLAALRANPSTSEIVVLVLTGMSRGAPEEWPGAHFIGKPFAPDLLIEKLNSLLAN